MLVVFACASRGSATTFILMSERDLTARSVAAVTGSVSDIEAAADPATGGVNTYIHIEPDQILFGTLPSGPVVLREMGGTLRDHSEWVFGSAEYRVGEQVLVFVSQHPDGSLHTTGMSMGKFSFETRPRGSRVAVRRLGEGVSLFDLQGRKLVSQQGPEEYDPQVLFDNVRAAAVATSTRAATRAASTSKAPAPSPVPVGEHHDAFTFLSNPSRWFEPDDGVPISFLIDPTGDVGVGPAVSRAAVDDALAAWTNVPTASVTLTDGGLLAQPLSYAGCTGGNRVVFNDPFNEITDPVGCSGVLAVGGFCASADMRTVNGTDFQRIRVGKVMFNNGWSQCPGWNRCNMAEVATHELGHTLGFGHATDPTATMYATAHFDGRCASLRADDLAGVNFVYPLVGTPAPTATPTPVAATATPASTASATASRTPTPTNPPSTATATAAPSTASPTATPIRTATRTTAPSATASATARPTASATATPRPTASSTATAIPTVSATASATAVPTDTPTVLSRHQVQGRVHYYSTDSDVPNVTVTLNGAVQQATLTSSSGAYAFEAVPSGAWVLGATKANDFNLGVTPLDAAYILQAVANLRSLTPMQALACDVTGDGTVSALDAARILQFSVGMADRLPIASACGSDWMFVPNPAPMEAQSVVAPSIGGGSCDSGKITLENLTDDATDQDFEAVLFGDCTGNWDNGDSTMAADSAPARRVRLGGLTLSGARAHVLVYVRSSTPYNAVDLQVTYDATRLTPTGAVLQQPASSALATANAPHPGVLRVAMASGEPITRRRGALLRLDFSRAASSPPPGKLRLVAAHVDEAPAIAMGDSAAPSP